MDDENSDPPERFPVDCAECGARAGLHAISCSRYPHADEPAPHLTDDELAVLRALVPYAWQTWPPDEHDRGLPVVDLRQDQLRALLDEIEIRRHSTA